MFRPVRALALLLLLPLAQAAPLDVDAVATQWSYEPEGWKNEQTPTDEQSLAIASGDWSTSLGAKAVITVVVSRDGSAPPAEWQYAATLSDGRTVLQGIVSEETPGRLAIAFDVDGQRPVAHIPAMPALVPGEWTLRVDASSPNGLGSNPQGWGTTSFWTKGVTFAGLHAGQPVLGLPLPEDAVPGMRDVGAGPNTWISESSLNPAGDIDVLFEAKPGDKIHWVAWTPSTLPATVNPATGSPAGPYVLTPNQANLGWTRINLGASIADANGVATLPIAGGSIEAQLNITHGLWALAGIGSTGVDSFLFAFAPDAPFIDAWDAPEPGASGPVTFGLEAPDHDGILLPGPAVVLLPDWHRDATRSKAGSALGPALMVQDGDSHFQGGYDGNLARTTGGGQTAVVAFLQSPKALCQTSPPMVCIEPGPHMAGTAYAGHASSLRGLDVELDVPLLGVGQAATITTRLHNPGLHDVRASVALSADETVLGQADVVVPAGGTLARAWPYTPQASGSLGIAATMDTGDMLWQARETVTVLDAAAYNRETAGPLERATPAPALAAFAALGLALLASRRSQA